MANAPAHPLPPKSIGGGFALVLSGSHAISLDALCRHFEVSAQDLQGALRKLPAVLTTGLSLQAARDLSHRLGRCGVTVTILPEESCGRYPGLGLRLKTGPGNGA